MIGTQLLALLPVLSTLVLAAPGKRTDHASEWSSSGSGSDSNKWSESSSYDSGKSYDSNSGNNYDSGYSYSAGGEYNSGSEWKDEGGGSGHATTISHETAITTQLSYETPKYGSGSMWGGDLQSCLNMCQAQFGSPSPSATATHTAAAGGETSPSKTENGGGGGSATHTVIVAPTKGVLRFVPFAIEGKEGDMVEFVWGAGPHTVTLSDGLNVCNKSTTANAFDSGKLNATATFSTKITSSSPQFHYCTVGTHCTAGMFGIINPPNNSTPPAVAAPPPASSSEASKTTVERPSSTAGQGGGKGGCESVDCWVTSWEASGAAPKSTVAAVKSACQGTEGSWAWGGKWDMSTLLVAGNGVSKETVVENVLYSRLMLSMNPTMMAPGTPSAGNFTAPPPLNEFVATYAASQDTSSTASTTSGESAAQASSSTEASSSDTSGEASKEAANAGTTTNGTGRIGISIGVTVLAVLGSASIIFF